MSDTAQPLRKKKASPKEEKIVTTIQGDSSDSDEELTVVQAPPADAQTTMKFMQRSAGGALQTSQAARAERALRQAVATHDLRSKVAPIYAALLASGDAGDSDAPADDKATLRMVGHYARFIDGEAWSDVQHQLATAGVKPVAADRTLLDFNIGASVSLAEKTKADQEVLAGERKAEEKAGEVVPSGSILNQRDQGDQAPSHQAGRAPAQTEVVERRRRKRRCVGGMNKLRTNRVRRFTVRAGRRVVHYQFAASSKTGVEVADGLCGYWREALSQ